MGLDRARKGEKAGLAPSCRSPERAGARSATHLEHHGKAGRSALDQDRFGGRRHVPEAARARFAQSLSERLGRLIFAQRADAPAARTSLGLVDCRDPAWAAPRGKWFRLSL